MPQLRRSLGRVAGQEDRGFEVRVVDELGERVELLPEEVLALDKAFLRKPIERELRVVRVGPNPRMVLCEYWELAQRRTCVVNVRDNRKWMAKMVFRMEEPAGDLEVQKPWVYTGKAPRRRGRW